MALTILLLSSSLFELGCIVPTFRRGSDRVAPAALANDRFSLFGVPSTSGNASTLGISATQAEPNARASLWIDDPTCVSSPAVSTVTVDWSGGLQWATVPLGADGLKNFYYRLEDRRGNKTACLSVGLSYLKDASPPTVVSMVRFHSNPTNSGTVSFTVTFTESVSSLSVSDFSVSGSTVSGASVLAVSGSGTTYTVSVSTGAGSGTLNLGVGTTPSAADAMGNVLVSNGTTGTYTVDRTAPSALSWTLDNPSPSATSNVTVPDLSFTGGEPGATVELFETACTGVAVATRVLGAMETIASLSPTVSGDGPHSWNYRLTDSLGNQSTCLSTSQSYTLDTDPPALSSIVRESPNPTAASEVVYTVTFDELVTGVGVADFVTTGSTVTSPSVTSVGPSNTGTVFSVTVSTGSGSGNVVLGLSSTASILDAGGNALPVTATTSTYTVDKDAPSGSISAQPSNPSYSGSASFSFSGSDSGGSGLAATPYECNVDGGAYASCSSPFVLNSLSGGEHTFSVRAIDQAGNLGMVGSVTWQVVLPSLTQITGGRQHACAIINGGAWCWGDNSFGQLGSGFGGGTRSAPSPVPGLESGISKISAGAFHTCAIQNGALKCFGNNTYGQLGGGTTLGSSAPSPVPSFESGVLHVATDGGTTCALVDGSVSCWGWNPYGQVGIGSTATTTYTTPQLLSVSRVSRLFTGAENTLCAEVGGEIQCWGSGMHGALGNGSGSDNLSPGNLSSASSGWTSFLSGNYTTHNCGVLGGILKCWGFNNERQVGDGTLTSRYTPVDVLLGGSPISGVSAISGSMNSTCYVKDGGVSCWGNNSDGVVGDGSLTDKSSPTVATGLTSGVTAIVGQGSAVHAIRNGSLWSWGTNTYGQLGDGTTTQRLTPVQIPDIGGGLQAIASGPEAYHTCAIVGGGLKCWADNASGQLGDGTTTWSSKAVTATVVAGGVSAFAGSPDHSCAVVNGAAKCWGNNDYGELGNGTTTPSLTAVSVGAPLSSGVSQIAAAMTFSCGIQNGAVHCWGNADNGRLGNGVLTGAFSTPQAVPTLTSGVLDVRVGVNHACALKQGAVYCWGDNGYGQLGDGTTTSSGSIVEASGTGPGVTAIATALRTTCALNSGGVWCWGEGGVGQLGDGTTVVSSATLVSVSTLTSGVTQLVGGAAHFCALKNGGVHCWGNNSYGQLGDGTTTHRSTPVAVTGLSSGVTQLSASASNSCAFVGGGVKCWGANLGNGTLTGSNVPVDVVGL